MVLYFYYLFYSFYSLLFKMPKLLRRRAIAKAASKAAIQRLIASKAAKKLKETEKQGKLLLF